MNKYKSDTPVLNFFLAFMLVTVIVGYDIAHTPNVEAQDIAPVASPSPTSEVSTIKVSEVTVTPTKKKNMIKVKMSHYTPQAGGLNCGNFVNGQCISKMANGQRWQDWMEKNVVACPKELAFGTKIKIEGVTYTCKDRGGMIKLTENDEYWLDVLTNEPKWNYGTVLTAELLN